MLYTIKERGNLHVKASTPLFALRKFVNKLVTNMRKRGGNPFDLKNEVITIVTEDGKENVYLFSIIRSEEQRSIYYDRDYAIRIFKLLRTL